AAGDSIAVVAQVTIDDYGHHPGRADTESFTRKMDSWPIDAMALNCSVGPKATLETIERMMLYSTKPMSAMPNAGLPQRIEGRNIYLCSPEYMAQYARRLLWAGVKIIGGCCGTTPEHIKLIRSETRSLQPGQKKLSATVEESGQKAHAMAPLTEAKKSQLGTKLAEGKFVSFVEILPPRGVDASREIEGARMCARNGIDCINVPDGPRASARMSAQVTCQLF